MKDLFRYIIKTEHSFGPLILRIAYAIVMFPHGAQKLLGWWGGFGYTGTMKYFTTEGGLSPLTAFLVIFLEFFGTLLIFSGILTRVISLASIFLFIGMIIAVHLPFGFFMDWHSIQGGEGYEYHILAIGILLSLLVSGAGKFSVDKLLNSKCNR
ncbi:DoxX family protein [Elizabethkingia anophelis]|uniref:DoxX family protein n=1 Tax=Elizabethkingia anophelis TaxID=1117645 RepID=UPI003786FC1A